MHKITARMARQLPYEKLDELRRENQQEALQTMRALPFAAISGYAYSPDEGLGRHRPGAYHIVLSEPLVSGRLRREPGDALCKPRRNFWGLDPRSDIEQNVPSCLRCIEIAQRLTAAAG